MAGTGFAVGVHDERRGVAGALVATDGARMAVWLSGEHDLASTGLLTAALAEAIAAEDRDVVVDMTYLTFMDGSTLGLLIRSRDFLAARSRRLTLRSVPRSARLLLDLSKLDAMVEAAPAVGPDAGGSVAATALETWVTVPLADSTSLAQPAPQPSPEQDDPEVVFG
jgi:anti-anti-sigma factor